MNTNEMFLLIDSYMQHNNFAHNLFVAYMSLYETNKRHDDILSKAPCFFTMTLYALNKSMLLEFSKLYCGSGKERTIYKLINLAKANLHLFNNKENIKTLCKNAEDDMGTKLKTVIENLKKRRNEDLAHNDVKFFDGLNNPALENRISCDDIDVLYEYTFNFLNALMDELSTEKKVELVRGADDFEPFIDEISSLYENASNTCE